MRGLVQRVEHASVTVIGADGETVVGAIGPGLCVLVGVTHDDVEATAVKMADKIHNLRVFDDDAGVMNRSIADTGGEVLIVSQFTLYADTTAGRRPSYIRASRPEHAEPLIDVVVAELRRRGATVATGRFRTEMKVSLVNDGPVTVMLEV
jgi:D-tyrosyl-tRNA(Tyr) deacylase